MKATIIYGAGATGKMLFPQIDAMYSAGQLFFADGNPNLWGGSLFGRQIINPEAIAQMEYDRIILTSIAGFETIPGRLASEFGVPAEKIDDSFVKEAYERTINTRNRFLECYAELAEKNKLDGSVAEGGVYEGCFAKRINAAFPERTLYLFDTFEGFDERDIAVEQGYTRDRAKHFNLGMTEAKLLSAMPHPDRIEIKKGYFPETAAGVNDTFVFVNLDFDLYQPTLAGLEFFYPKMVRGGVILVHDYFQNSVIPDQTLVFQGIRKAVDEFCSDHGVYPFPIGDILSIGIIKS